MTASNEQNIPTKRLAEISKTVVLFLALGIGMVYVLLYFDLNYIVAAIFAILAVVIVFFAFQKRLPIYAVFALMIALLFTASGFVLGYSRYVGALPSLTPVRPGQVGGGLFCIGVGLFLVIATRAMSDMNTSDFWGSRYQIKFKYPMFSIVAFFILGLIFIAEGIYLVVNGFHYL